jgi:hypothetical protein
LQIEGWHCQIACLKNFLYFNVKMWFFSLLKLLLCYTLGRYSSAINKFRFIFTSTLSEKKNIGQNKRLKFSQNELKSMNYLNRIQYVCHIFWLHIVFWTFFIAINFNYLLAASFGSVFGSLQLLAFKNESVCT